VHERYEHAVLLSFEGPDPYATVGGLATRVTDLAGALGAAGVKTTLVFMGDPRKPNTEQASPNVRYRRWSQHISVRYPGGVYEGEHDKIADLTASLPRFIADEIVAPAARRGKRTLVIAEEWQTAPAIIALDRLLRECDVRSAAALLWNANNTYGFERVAWEQLRHAARITTVSKFMKHILHGMNVEALVIPNGIADRLLAGANATLVQAFERALPQRPLFVKVGRFDPDKRWMQAIDAFALLRARLPDARLVLRGGREAYGLEVLNRAREQGLLVEEVHADASDPHTLAGALERTRAPIVSIRSFASEEQLLALYRVADAVIANSGKEPFGLVGLEVMASGGVAVCGATGEEYAQPFVNAIVCDTDDPLELSVALAALGEKKFARNMREAGRLTAQRYTWSRVLEVLERKLAYIEAC
jgi:glycosyltransferase involved in cell wall biosynthesis